MSDKLPRVEGREWCVRLSAQALSGEDRKAVMFISVMLPIKGA